MSSKFKRFYKLCGIFAVIMIILTVFSAYVLLSGLGDTHHTAWMILCFLSLAVAIELTTISLYAKYFFSKKQVAARKNAAAHQDDLDRAGYEKSLASFENMMQKNAVQLTKYEQAEARRAAQSGVTFHVDAAEETKGTAVGKIVGAFSDAPMKPNPEHGETPKNDRSLDELFQSLTIDSLTTTRTDGGGILVRVSVYNPGPDTIDGSLKADIYDFNAKKVGTAYLVLPLNGIRPHQTAQLSGICAVDGTAYDTVNCLPNNLQSFAYAPSSQDKEGGVGDA